MCVFPDGTSADAWDFLSGSTALNWSYCSREGYEAKQVTSLQICNASDSCTVCVLPNKTEVEVTKLMGLSFEEGICGDGSCVLGENYANCPQDCPSGSFDAYCDGVVDGKCDPDCVSESTPEKDPDCVQPTTTTIPVPKPFSSIYIYVILIVIVIAVIAIFFLRKIKIVR
jgi:putative hemolysin